MPRLRKCRGASLSVSSNGSLGLKHKLDLELPGIFNSFSILERIVGVETCWRSPPSTTAATFSILERIVGVETLVQCLAHCKYSRILSVSSNGSLGLKQWPTLRSLQFNVTFSILERIVGVETRYGVCQVRLDETFSILERIVGVETRSRGRGGARQS